MTAEKKIEALSAIDRKWKRASDRLRKGKEVKTMDKSMIDAFTKAGCGLAIKRGTFVLLPEGRE